MKALIFLLVLTTVPALAKPLIVINYYDAFNRAPFNNSEKVAKALAKKLNGPRLTVKLCGLNTVFNRAYAQSEECLKGLPQTPVMVLGLGEAFCELKVEAMVKNLDRTTNPDNEGNHRRSTEIIPEGPKRIGLRYPIPQMYCTLEKRDRKKITVSSSAGSFVCNNTAYQMSYYYPETVFGFIHVPNNKCSNLKARTAEAIANLEKMILAGVKVLMSSEGPEDLPHSSNETRLPTTQAQMEILEDTYRRKDPCISEYFNRLQKY